MAHRGGVLVYGDPNQVPVATGSGVMTMGSEHRPSTRAFWTGDLIHRAGRAA